MEKVTQNHYGSGDNVGHKDVHYHEALHTIPKLLTQKSGLASDNFVGREKELAKINELLNQESALLLLNGIGGIGKSTLASCYFNKERDKFDYCGFIEVGEDIKSSFSSVFSTSLDLKSEKIDDSFNEVMNKLQNLEGDKLLVLDDIKNIATQKDEINTILTLRNSGFKILFTSREVKENIPQYYLDTMSKEDARKLFLQYHPTDEIEKMDRILEYLDYHTFFIKLIANTMTNEGYRCINILDKFEKGDLAQIKFTDMEQGHEASFKQNLRELFSIQKLKDEYILLLKQLSFLPSIDIPVTLLEAMLGKKMLKGKLNFLVNNGWLIKNNDYYKLHQITKEYILADFYPEYREIKFLVDYSSQKLIKIENIMQIIQSDILYSILSEISKHLQKNFIMNTHARRFLKNLSSFYFDLKEKNMTIKRYIELLKELLEGITNDFSSNKEMLNNSAISLASETSLTGSYRNIWNNLYAIQTCSHAIYIDEAIPSSMNETHIFSYKYLALLYLANSNYLQSYNAMKKAIKLMYENAYIDTFYIKKAEVFLGQIEERIPKQLTWKKDYE